jgi:hypothetical protein
VTVTTTCADALDTGSVTVIVAVPAATPVTTPPDTVAKAVLDEFHCKLEGVAIGLPFPSVAKTDKVRVEPAAIDGDAGEIVRTTVTTTFTV